MRLNVRRTRVGRTRGERLTKRKGVSIEFADYRDYTPGDDLRHVDWNVLARLDAPVMRTYQDEEDLNVYVLLDRSPSMEFGTPPKIEAARRLAEAIGLAALAGGDGVTPVSLSGPNERARVRRGRTGFRPLAQWFSQADSAPRSLPGALREFAGTARATGLAVIVSDFLDPEVAPALRQVAARRHEIWALQILAAEDLEPDLEGDLTLVDSENQGSLVEVTANADALRAYRANLEAHIALIRETALSRGGRFATVRSDTPLEHLLNETLRREGWMR
jgi:uncharacterized protein (DUF58 family)